MPEGTVDVIPVDLVVAAIIAVAALGPSRGAAPSRRSPSGGGQPAASTARWSTTCGAGSPSTRCTTPRASRSSCPSGSFPGRGRVQGQLDAGQDGASSRAEQVLQALPLRGKQAEWSAKLEDQARRGRAGPRVRRAVRRSTPSARRSTASTTCWRSADALDAGRPGDVRLRPPRHRLARLRQRRSTCRRSSQHARVKTTPGKTHAPTAPSRLRRSVLVARPPPRRLRPREHAHRQQRRRELLVAGHPPARPPRARPLRAADAGRGARRCWRLDRKDRGDFLRFFYRRYEDAPVDADRRGRRRAAQPTLILTKSFPAGIRRVREHRALGHRTVLITGALDFAVEPLRPLFDEIIAAEMTVRAGRHLQRAS